MMFEPSRWLPVGVEPVNPQMPGRSGRGYADQDGLRLAATLAHQSAEALPPGHGQLSIPLFP
jgi:hypothetical protein